MNAHYRFLHQLRRARIAGESSDRPDVGTTRIGDDGARALHRPPRLNPRRSGALSLVLILVASIVFAVPAMANASDEANITGGEYLRAGDAVASADGSYQITMQSDGNLVIYQGGSATWQSRTGGNQGAYAAMQTDGNFVVYSSAGLVLWHTRTNGNSGAFGRMQSDGNLVIYNSDSQPLWDARTDDARATATLPSGQQLQSGDFMRSSDRRYELRMQSDGNLVLVLDGSPIWNAGTGGNPGSRAVMQTDGNFVVYSAGGQALWHTRTTGNSSAYASLQTDGNFVIYSASRTPLWDVQGNVRPPCPTGPVGIDQTTVVRNIRLHRCIEDNVRRLIDHAASDGIQLAGWGWRDPETQKRLRRQNCGPTSGYDPGDYTVPSSSCSPPTARPGRSMHERGLAVDFQNCSSRSTTCYRWLNQHAAAYGLKNLPSEPWHWSTNGR